MQSGGISLFLQASSDQKVLLLVILYKINFRIQIKYDEQSSFTNFDDLLLFTILFLRRWKD